MWKLPLALQKRSEFSEKKEGFNEKIKVGLENFNVQISSICFFLWHYVVEICTDLASTCPRINQLIGSEAFHDAIIL